MHLATFGLLHRLNVSSRLAERLTIPSAFRTFHSTQASNVSQARARRWTASEETILIRAVNEGKRFDDIAKLLPGRSVIALRKQAQALRRNGKDIRRRQAWTADEDAALKNARQIGLSWRETLKAIPGRTIGQAYDRWRWSFMTHTLEQRSMRTGVPFSPKEGAELKHCREVLGLSYSEIAARIPPRRPGTLKSRYAFITPASERTTMRLRKKWQAEDATS